MNTRFVARVVRMAMVSHMALAAAYALPAAAQDTTTAQNAPAEPTPQEVEGEADIIVTGTSIRGVAPVGSQLLQLDQQDIQDSGQQTTAGLLASIPQFDTFGSRPVPLSSGAAPTTPPSLRSLGPGATLSLLNSHRLVGIGTLSTVADPTSLPLAAIGRLEVVADGASATYGSDAIGGVINVILRKDLDGLDARATMGVAEGYTEKTVSLVGGKKWSTGSFLLGAQYQNNSALLGSRRDYITEDFRSVGGGDNRTFYTALPNVTVNGATYGYNGTGFNTTPNLTSVAQEGDLLPASRRWTAVLNAEQRIGDNIRLFVDGNYGNLHSVFRQSPAADALDFTLTSANPFFRSPVPGATSVRVQQGSYQLIGQYHENLQDIEYWGVNGGAEVDFTDKWSGRVGVNYGRSHTEVDQDTYDTAAFAAAVGSSDPATAYDPFTGRTSAATIARITDAIATPGSTQKLFQATGVIDGALFSLPGGDVKVAIGGEYRKESYDGLGINGARSAPVTTVITSRRDVWSAYGELFVPLVGEESNIPLIRKLELNAAVRHDSYSDFGKTTNPKFGANWEVVEGLTVRGTYGKSFHAPSLADLKAIDDLAFYAPGTVAPGVFTPPGSSTPLNLILLAGGNANLKPEKATTWSLGADFTPTFVPGLRLSGTYFDIDYTDKVVIPVGYAFLTPELTNLLVIFNPTEAQIDQLTAGLTPVGARFAPGEADILVDARRTNLGSSHVKGVDFAASYNFDLADGRAVAEISGTHLLSKKSTAVPGSTPLDDLATTATPAWRFRSHLGWRSEVFGANIFWSHVGEYNNTNVTPVQRVSSFDPVDLNFSIKVPGAGIGKSFQIQLDVLNLFDENPPRLYSGNGAFNPASFLISTPASPIGRMFQVSVRTEF